MARSRTDRRVSAESRATRGCHSAMPRTPRGVQEAKRRAGLFARPGGRTPVDAQSGKRCEWDSVSGVWRNAAGRIAVSRRPTRTDRATSRGFHPAVADAAPICPHHAELAAHRVQGQRQPQPQGLHASIQRSRELLAARQPIVRSAEPGEAAVHAPRALMSPIPLNHLLDLIEYRDV